MSSASCGLSRVPPCTTPHSATSPSYWQVGFAASLPNPRSATDAPGVLFAPTRCLSAFLAILTQGGIAGDPRGLMEQDLSHMAINRELGLPGAYTEQVDAFIERVDR